MGLSYAAHTQGALGSAGALTWFEPIQPVLQAVAVALLGWALFARLEGERSCPVGLTRETVDVGSDEPRPR